MYSAYSGRVVKVEASPSGSKGNVTIDQHPFGLGFLTSYNHIAEIRVEPGQFVHEGEPIAQVVRPRFCVRWERDVSARIRGDALWT